MALPAASGRVGRHHADDHLVESEYRSVFLKLFPRYAGRARRGATVAGDNLRGTAVVVENAPKTIVKPTALGPVANTDTKLLIYGLFQKGLVLAQDASG